MTPSPPVSRFLVVGVWCGVVLLVAIGVAAALGRSLFVADLATRGELVRERALQALGRDDPFRLQRPEEIRLVDRRFAAHAVVTLLHVLPGGVFLVLAPFQLSSRIRNRHIRFHRWSGRILVLVGFVTVLTGLYFGLLMPYGGPAEALAIALVGGLFLTAVGKAVLAVRRGDVARHREWMIRAFAVTLGISTDRLVGAVVDLVLTPAGLGLRPAFVLSIWTGWALTIGAAELWIAHTRSHAHLVAVPAGELRL